MLITFVSCQKDELDTTASEPSTELDGLTDLDLRSSKKFVTIVGQNDPDKDLPAVQNAVDTYDFIKLTGTFDFGMDEVAGAVDINRPNVFIKGPATIVNGAKLEDVPEIGFWKFPLSIRMPGVILSNIEFTGNHDGILVYAQDDGRPVILYKNNIAASGAAVGCTATPGGLKMYRNTMDAFFNYFAIASTGHTQIVKNNMTSGYDCVFMFGFDHKLDVLYNTMSSTGYEGMFIGSWRVSSATGPDWGDNPPVRIIGNDIDIEGMDAAGIIVGTSIHGLNNALVTGNKITGMAGFSGLLKEPYGRNNKIMYNDLSGLTTYGPQIWLMGSRDNLFKNNKLGTVVPIPGGGFVPAFRTSTTLISTINWHQFDGLDGPDPVNYGNRFVYNDYRNTGVPGWSDDPESYGAVILLDFIQQIDVEGTPYEEPFVMKNYVAEKKFPTGTDVCTQVLDLNPGSNHIVGIDDCEEEDDKSSAKLSTKDYNALTKLAVEREKRRTAALRNARKGANFF